MKKLPSGSTREEKPLPSPFGLNIRALIEAEKRGKAQASQRASAAETLANQLAQHKELPHTPLPDHLKNEIAHQVQPPVTH